MTDNNEIKSLERRNFLKLQEQPASGIAVVAGAGGALLSDKAMAMTQMEEMNRAKNAKYTMTLATAYKLGASREYPIMQLDMKENIQNATNGAVYVKLAPAKRLCWWCTG